MKCLQIQVDRNQKSEIKERGEFNISRQLEREKERKKCKRRKSRNEKRNYY